MKLDRSSRNLYTLVFLTFAAMGAMGSQCARVNDGTVGPDSNPLAETGGVAQCVQACNDIARDARRVENDRFRAAMAACGRDSVCRVEEAARHEANIEQISDNQETCKGNCHEQGGGGGGQ